LREFLREKALRNGSKSLHSRLAEADPAAAAKIHPNDLFRTVRALEILYVTGKPPSLLRTQSVSAPSAPAAAEFTYRVFCLHVPREKLYDRINKRVELMYNKGLIEETASALEAYPLSGSFLSRTIGYAQALGVLERRVDRDAALEETKKQTRRFAKRQLTWFRSLNGVTWLNSEIGGGEGPLEFLLNGCRSVGILG